MVKPHHHPGYQVVLHARDRTSPYQKATLAYQHPYNSHPTAEEEIVAGIIYLSKLCLV